MSEYLETGKGRFILRDKSGRAFLIVEGCQDKLDATLYGLRNHITRFGSAQAISDLVEQRQRLIQAFRHMGLTEHEAEIAAEGRSGPVISSVPTTEYSDKRKINLK